MKLEVQYTLEDFREAQREATAQRRPKPKRGFVAGLFSWFALVALYTCYWLLSKLRFGGGPPEHRPQDLLPTLLPNLVMALFILVLLVSVIAANVSVRHRRGVFGAESREQNARLPVLLLMLMLALIIGAVAAQALLPAVQWRASRFEAMLVGFAPWLVALVALGLVLAWYSKRMIAVAWESNPALHRPHVLEIRDDGVTSSDEHGTSFHRWAAFMRYRESQNLYILVLEDTRFLMMPKRYFADQTMEQALRALVQSKIAEGYFLELSHGAFPVVALPPPPLASR